MLLRNLNGYEAYVNQGVFGSNSESNLEKQICSKMTAKHPEESVTLLYVKWRVR